MCRRLAVHVTVCLVNSIARNSARNKQQGGYGAEIGRHGSVRLSVTAAHEIRQRACSNLVTDRARGIAKDVHHQISVWE